MWINVKSFSGITGPVAIDQLGDRIADFDVFDMYDSSSRAFQVYHTKIIIIKSSSFNIINI